MTGSPPPITVKSVCAVVVAYFPDDGFESRLASIVGQVATLVIVDNTPDEMTLSHAFRDSWAGALFLISNRANKGIAFALNQGLEFASDAGYEWLLTLDQDTLCLPYMVESLLAIANVCALKPMVIGSNYYDSQNNRTKVPVGDGTDFLDQKTVITSGSFIAVHSAIAIGGFREDYFIDQVDHEFCLRARANGHRVIIARKPVMVHSVGNHGGVKLPWLGILPNHPPVRKYYIARNTIVTVAIYWRNEPVWCVKRLIRLFLGLLEMAILEAHRMHKTHAFLAGVADGLNQRMGACQRAALQEKESNCSIEQ